MRKENAMLTFKRIIGKKNRVWYIGSDNPANQIFVFDPATPPRHCGYEIDFTLKNGVIATVTGPKHSNAEALFQDTGYLIR